MHSVLKSKYNYFCLKMDYLIIIIILINESNHFFVLSQDEIIGRQRYTKNYCCDAFKAVNPFFTLRPLTADVKHPESKLQKVKNKKKTDVTNGYKFLSYQLIFQLRKNILSINREKGQFFYLSTVKPRGRHQLRCISNSRGILITGIRFFNRH